MEKHLYYYPNHAAFLSSTDLKNIHNVIYCDNETHLHYDYYDYSKDYLTFIAKENGTFTFTPQNNNIISYSTDSGETWTDGNSVQVNNGDKVMWKGTMTPSSGIGKFGSTANFDVQGNIMSLLFGDNYKGQLDLTGKTYVFLSLFNSNTKIINAKNLSLPATTLALGCYLVMFFQCENLITAPLLPATILAGGCYMNMFLGCISLIIAPELPATTLEPSCYSSMFYGCTNLTTAPLLPATTLAAQCYLQMFYNCISLTTAPALPATTLVDMCYYHMFRSCTNLTTAPEILPATTLADSCYTYMFNDCTSLTTAPELPATTLASSCYTGMFKNCTNLNYIKAMFTTTPSTTYTTNWVEGVAASGTFVKNSAATWNVSGDNGIPSGWTVEIANIEANVPSGGSND